MGSRVGRSEAPRSLEEVLEWLDRAPPGTAVDAAVMRELIEGATGPIPPRIETTNAEPTWRERLWTAPPETRIGVKELAEALGRPKSWVYRRTGKNAEKAPLPHRKLDGELVFVVAEIRAWLVEHETTIAPHVSLEPITDTRRRG